MAKYYLPWVGGQISEDKAPNGKLSPEQMSPILNSYSPRLFGSPPQLTSLNDMRLLSSKDGKAGPVGDFYLQNILQDAQVANFVIGRAIFTGGMNNIVNTLRLMYQYGKAMSNYSILGPSGVDASTNRESLNSLAQELEVKNKMLSEMKEEEDNMHEAYANYDINDPNSQHVLNENNAAAVDSIFGTASGVLSSISTPLMHSLSVQQPFYTFESDWFTYINNVKMMINTAVIMLGLQKSCVRIGDRYEPIGVNPQLRPDIDVWSNYRFITPSKTMKDITGIDRQTGDTNQYVSFMIEPTGANESYVNNVGESQIHSSVIKQGEGIGNEIAFITNASVSKVDDAVLNMANGAVGAAQGLVSTLGGGVGRFTASIAGSMTKSFLGDHTIYPQVFQNHTSTQSVNLRTKLRATDGSAYAYLTNLLVPLFHIFGMVFPSLSKNNASAYTFPPLVQCHIPGLWGTRLGMVTSVNVTKNPGGNEASVGGWPTAVDVDITVTDLTNVLVTSPMNQPAVFLNNHTMFDYIAQCTGVDKYRVNPSMRLITKLALSQSAWDGFLGNVGSGIVNDFTTYANRLSGIYRL